MKQEELLQKIKELLQHSESEVVEWMFTVYGEVFREKVKYVADYISALSMEANDRGFEFAYLILGINEDTSALEGTPFMHGEENFDELKDLLYKRSRKVLTLQNVYRYVLENGRHVLLLEIPAAPQGMLVSSSGYCWQRRRPGLIPLERRLRDKIKHQAR
jgi:ATP-dependent DNA helicase RecG